MPSLHRDYNEAQARTGESWEDKKIPRDHRRDGQRCGNLGTGMQVIEL